MKLNILTPEKMVFEGDAEAVNLPTRSGYITVLSGHEPLFAATKAGNIRVKSKDKERIFMAERGVLQTINSKTSLLLRKCVEK